MKLYKQEGYDLMGVAMAVYHEMGSGLLEAFYQECLEREWGIRSIPFQAQPRLTVSYRGQILEQRHRPDLLMFGEIIAELKAMKSLGTAKQAPLLNYLAITGTKVGYLINLTSAHRKVFSGSGSCGNPQIP